jgi:hypothetical protein
MRLFSFLDVVEDLPKAAQRQVARPAHGIWTAREALWQTPPRPDMKPLGGFHA